MQHRQTVARYDHNKPSPFHLQRSGTSDLQRCCQTDDAVHAPLSSRNTSHVMNNRSPSVVSIYVLVISFDFYKLFSTVGPYPRVWPNVYRMPVYGRILQPPRMAEIRGTFGHIRRWHSATDGCIRRAYTGVCPYGGCFLFRPRAPLRPLLFGPPFEREGEQEPSAFLGNELQS